MYATLYDLCENCCNYGLATINLYMELYHLHICCELNHTNTNIVRSAEDEKRYHL